ncbi:hypothetical protein TNCV_1016361 [Trichonephila clavipes]|uniref:Uncharacterized protein n=1 Tax=Trichonephila clavipes TaxID=2585209 RepID=A0A8X6VY19_TRICX|nr:hypothetical protein TNCV_1016361 [Trichonephila clavipes]
MDVSGKVFKTRNALNVRRLLTPLKTLKMFLRCLHAEIVEVEIEVVSPSIAPSENFAELNRTVTCMVLKANDRRTSSMPR